ncbi:MAG: hypothetical protein DMF96_03035 [Acidobacteria bacterium]|nr:MAG: hypothetical protein DMF96_03035 [Acidobacteriota bacterium]
MIGVSIGIASLAGMVSLGLGLQDQFVGRFLKSGMFDAITVMSPKIVPASWPAECAASARALAASRGRVWMTMR